MNESPRVSMKRLRHDRRIRGECADGCGNKSGKYYLCSTCREKFEKRKMRFKEGIKKVTRDPRRLLMSGM